MPDLKTVALPEAAVILRLPYREAYDSLLRGELDGRRTGGRWHVTLASVHRIQRDRENVVTGQTKSD